jgi:hypothetical protein
MRKFEATVTARRDEYLGKILSLNLRLGSLPPGSPLAASLRRTLAMYHDMLTAIERHGAEFLSDAREIEKEMAA